MHILVVHAMVILLTLGPPRGEQPAGVQPPPQPRPWEGTRATVSLPVGDGAWGSA